MVISRSTSAFSIGINAPTASLRLVFLATRLLELCGQFTASVPKRFLPVCLWTYASLGCFVLAQQRDSAGSADRAQVFLTERAALAQELDAVQQAHRQDTASIRLQAIASWREQNAARINAVREEAKRLSLAQAKPGIALIEEVELPQDATTDLEEFLVERAKLYNERATVENELGAARLNDKQQAVLAWRVANRSRLEAQQSRASALAAVAGAMQLPEPLPPNIPSAATPEVRAFLVERHALAQERVAEENRIRQLPAAERNDARREWHQRGAGRLSTLNEMAQQILR